MCVFFLVWTCFVCVRSRDLCALFVCGPHCLCALHMYVSVYGFFLVRALCAFVVLCVFV